MVEEGYLLTTKTGSQAVSEHEGGIKSSSIGSLKLNHLDCSKTYDL